MIDDVLLVMDITPPKEVINGTKQPFIWKDLIFAPSFRKDCVIKYTATWKNLKLEIWYDQLKVNNSWHKFYHGNNYSDYTFEDIKQTIELFVEKFGLNFLKASIKKLTIGCNLSINSNKYYPRCISLGTTFFQEMRGGNTHVVYGQYAKQTNIKFKIYDKQYEVKIHNREKIVPTLRVEQEMNMNYIRKRKDTSIRIYTPSDLLQRDWLVDVIFELTLQTDRINFSGDLPIEKSDSLIESEIKILMGNLQYRKIIKTKASPKTYQKRVKIYDKMLENYEVKKASDRLSRLVGNKMNLLAGPNMG
ncbi:hypothetical protein [Echinicola sp. 20G]|uniref:hypothetical protein n=1 Tax=Echinicola sp. 20G TaxID=2781961 RepID=UPI00191018F0|nr:hypothetical protein [Echinicola sp. 20G]